MKKIWVLTMLPEFFEPFVRFGVVGKGLSQSEGVRLEVIRISDYSEKGFKGVDSAPYGGGAGMVMRADVLEKALIQGVYESGLYQDRKELEVIYCSPRGQVWSQKEASKYAKDFDKDLVIICGRYEGIDERFLELYVDRHISLGDFILSGGEVAAMAFIDSTVRLMPNVLGNHVSIVEESFEGDLLEYPQYTKPRSFQGQEVPTVLLEGNHQKISSWRENQRLEMTKKFRPDLLKGKKT